jgi:hypothetical protein
MHARGMAVVLAASVAVGFHLRSPRPGRIQRWVTPRQPTDDVHTAGRTVHIQNEVAGDVAAAGAEVTIVGPVNGYVMSACDP